MDFMSYLDAAGTAFTTMSNAALALAAAVAADPQVPATIAYCTTQFNNAKTVFAGTQANIDAYYGSL
jgi:hypothetical protein